MKKTLAILLAIMMVFQVCACGSAEEESNTYIVQFTDKDGVTREYEVTGGLYTDDAGQYVIDDSIISGPYTGVVSPESPDGPITVTVNGDVSSSQGSGVSVFGQNSVTVAGDLEAFNTGINAEDEATVHVGGEINVGHTEERQNSGYNELGEYTTITEEYGTGTAVSVTGDVEIVVEGNVNSKGSGVAITNQMVQDEETGKWVTVVSNSDVMINGSVTAEDGIAVQSSGNNTIRIDGDVAGDHDAVSVSNTDLTVNGDVNQTGTTRFPSFEYGEDGQRTLVGWRTSGTGTGLKVDGDSSVEINGDVHAMGQGVLGENSTNMDPETGKITDIMNASEVTVTGDVVSEYSNGVRANGEMDVDIGGSVKANGLGVDVNDKATVNIGGGITAGHIIKQDEMGYNEKGEYVEIIRDRGYGDAINASGDVEIVVGGDIVAKEDGIRIYDLYSYDYENKKFENIESNSAVTVNGSVTSEFGEAVYSKGNNTILIDGDIVGENGGLNVSDTDITVKGNVEQTGTDRNPIFKYGENGEETLIGWNTYGSGSGVVANGESSVVINGDISAMGTGVNAGSAYDWDPETNTEIIVKNTSDITVKGDVTSQHEDGISASGEASIDIGGSVKAGQQGVYAYENATVNVGGNVESKGSGVIVRDHASVNVGGDIVAGTEGRGTAIAASDDGAVNVAGNVVSNGGMAVNITNMEYRNAEGEWVTEETTAQVHIGGDIDAALNGISAAGNAVIQLDGSLVAEDGYGLNINEAGKDLLIIVEGDITAGYTEGTETEVESAVEPVELTLDEEKLQEKIDELFADVELEMVNYKDLNNGAVVVDTTVQQEPQESAGTIIIQGSVNAVGEADAFIVNLYVPEDQEVALPEIPAMTVFELNTEGGELIDLNATTTITREMDEDIYAREFELDLEEQKKTELVDAIAATIQYIIKVTQPENGSIDLSGATYDAMSDQLVAHEGDDLSLTVTVDEGYYVDAMAAGAKATVIDNGDGTWTVTVERGGGVSISANIVLCPHNWAIVDQQAPGCTANGYTDRVCTICGKQDHSIQYAYGHDYPDVFTSNNNGTHSARCTNGCGEPLTYPCEMEVIEAGGIRYSVCRVCGYSITETVEVNTEAMVEAALAAGNTVENAITDAETITAIADELVKRLNAAEENTTVVSEQVKDAKFDAVETEVVTVTETGEQVTKQLPKLYGTLVVREQKSVISAASDQGDAAKAAEPQSESLMVYNISLVHEGKNMKLDRKIRIELPLSESVISALNTRVLILVTEDGLMIEIPYEIIDGKAVFETSYLGMFAFMEKDIL